MGTARRSARHSESPRRAAIIEKSSADAIITADAEAGSQAASLNRLTRHGHKRREKAPAVESRSCAASLHLVKQPTGRIAGEILVRL